MEDIEKALQLLRLEDKIELIPSTIDPEIVGYLKYNNILHLMHNIQELRTHTKKMNKINNKHINNNINNQTNINQKRTFDDMSSFISNDNQTIIQSTNSGISSLLPPALKKRKLDNGNPSIIDDDKSKGFVTNKNKMKKKIVC